ncbi:hypothetical protein DXG03_007741 [Asterophora parasitica]|uniref:KA1 domain-containing protein n=1 Tax=Asterophora parasitica TaxID=117018 RepID=A0A9P7KES5_9AGAR|nr:hypothetical protein DXG03_007741 [Asterophora parasitica]
MVRGESDYRLRCIRPRRLEDAADPTDVARDIGANLSSNGGGATNGIGGSSGSSQRTATLASTKPVYTVPLDAHKHAHEGQELFSLSPVYTPSVPYTRPHPHPDLHLHPHHQPHAQTEPPSHPPRAKHAHHQPQAQTGPQAHPHGHAHHYSHVQTQLEPHLHLHTHHVHPQAFPPLPPSSAPSATSSASSSSLERQLLSCPDEPHKIAYGPFPADPGDEVRFTIELTRIALLKGTYSLDIRRLKGNLKSYGFLYEEVRKRVGDVL